MPAGPAVPRWRTECLDQRCPADQPVGKKGIPGIEKRRSKSSWRRGRELYQASIRGMVLRSA